MEITAVGPPVEVVMHHPDGGFRRFMLDDQNGWIVADGAEQVDFERLSMPSFGGDGDDGFWEFSVGSDRYRVALEQIPEQQ